jgi:hypothetical protein
MWGKRRFRHRRERTKQSRSTKFKQLTCLVGEGNANYRTVRLPSSGGKGRYRAAGMWVLRLSTITPMTRS